MSIRLPWMSRGGPVPRHSADVTARRLRAVLLLAAAVPAAAATAAAVLKANHLKVYADRYRIEITARPRPNCFQCRGAGGWWTGGPFPDIEACSCWADRRELRIRLLPTHVPWPAVGGTHTTPLLRRVA